MNREKIFRILPFLLGLLFIAACLIHYFSERPLWLDEQTVLTIIEKYDYSEFIQEFNPAQSFPRVYLAGIKVLGARYDNHVLSLRFFALLAMLAAFFLWRKLYYSALSDPELRAVSLFAFCASFFMIYYAAEFKPYSMDVLLVAIYTWFLLRQGQFLPTKELIIAGVLPLLLFFSYGLLFVFWMVPLNYLLYLRGSRKFFKSFLVSSISSVICFGLFMYFDVRHSITTAGVNYWESYFLCIENLKCFGEPFGEGLKRLAIVWWSREKLFQRAAIPFLPALLYGAFRYGVSAWRAHKGTLTQIPSIGLALILELFILGIFKKYPFTGGRLILFMAPFLMYFIILGLRDFRKVKFVGPVMWSYFYVYLIAVFGYNFIHFIKLH